MKVTDSLPTDESYEDLVLKYKKSQAALKQVGTSKKKPLQVSSDPIFFSVCFHDVYVDFYHVYI